MNTIIGESGANGQYQRRNVQDKPTFIDVIINVFIRCLDIDEREREFNTIIKRTNKGNTGSTFLVDLNIKLLNKELLTKKHKEVDCISQIPAWAKYGEFFKFVIKFAKSGELKNEAVCSDLFKKYGFSSPDYYLISEESTNRLKAKISKLELSANDREKISQNSRKNKDENIGAVFMFAFKGSNLGDSIEGKILHGSKETELERIFITLGRGAFFDLLIGNTDRLFRFQTYFSDDSQELYEGDFVNDGNLMLEMEYNEPEQGRSLKNIHFIDNTTHSLRYMDAETYYNTNFFPACKDVDRFLTSVLNGISEGFRKHNESLFFNTIDRSNIVILLKTGFMSGVRDFIQSELSDFAGKIPSEIVEKKSKNMLDYLVNNQEYIKGILKCLHQ
jgi:hypothetical protein